MKKYKLLAAAIALCGASSVALAQPQTPAPQAAPQSGAPSAQQQPGPQGMWQGRRGYNDRNGSGQGRFAQMSEADRAAFLEARLAAIKAGLTLSDAQQKLWPAVESAMRELHKQRIERAERLRKDGVPANPLDRMKLAGESMTARGAAMTKMAEASKPLYDTLSDDQKRRLQMLTRGHFAGLGGDSRGGRFEDSRSDRHNRHHWREDGRRGDRDWQGYGQGHGQDQGRERWRRM